MRSLVVTIGSNHGETPEKHGNASLKDLHNYDTKLGLAPEAVALEKRVQLLNKEIDSLKEEIGAKKKDITNLERAYSRQQEEIKAYA